MLSSYGCPTFYSVGSPSHFLCQGQNDLFSLCPCGGGCNIPLADEEKFRRRFPQTGMACCRRTPQRSRKRRRFPRKTPCLKKTNSQTKTKMKTFSRRMSRWGMRRRNVSSVVMCRQGMRRCNASSVALCGRNVFAQHSVSVRSNVAPQCLETLIFLCLTWLLVSQQKKSSFCRNKAGVGTNIASCRTHSFSNGQVCEKL